MSRLLEVTVFTTTKVVGKYFLDCILKEILKFDWYWTGKVKSMDKSHHDGTCLVLIL